MFIQNNTDLFYAFLAVHKAAKDQGLLFNLDVTYIQKIIEAYNEPWRRYHTLTHVNEGCRMLLGLWDTMEDPASTMFAWIHHDIVFLTTAAGENEERSAQIVESLHEKVDKRIIERAAAIIRATNGHVLPDTFCGNMDDLAVVLDVDLSGFGDRRNEFVEVGELIREENGQTPEEWKAGRAGFAKMLLGRTSLFKTAHFAHLEEQAQNNLTWAASQAA